MRSQKLAVSLLLVFAPALSCFATVSHLHAAHRRALRLEHAAPHAYRAYRHRETEPRRRRGDARVARLLRRNRCVRIEPQIAAVRTTIPTIPLRNARLIAPLVGSRASLVRQNVRTEEDGLGRIEDDAQLNQMRRDRQLVALPASLQLRVNEALPGNRRSCRPWTAKFLTDVARAHFARFHRALQVNSAVRTVEYQRYLMEVNGNAAPADGDIASPHLTGATIDIGKKGLSFSEVAWLRAYLLPLEQAGKLDVEEEFYQSCFHITVYKSYAPSLAPARNSAATLLAARLR
jgi:hypothetical protein